MMRIITGSARGTKLKTLEGSDTRPTSERVKEAIFSMIQFDIEGRQVLDLFAGSGQLGLEALSRGAEGAMFVDNSAAAIAIVKENAEKTHLFNRCRFLVSDYRNYLRKASALEKRSSGLSEDDLPKQGVFDIVFLDPPYDTGAIADALAKLSKSGLLKQSALVICESSEDEDPAQNLEVTALYNVIKSTSHGRAQINILTPKASESTDTENQ